MVLYAYMCVYAFSFRRESPGRILGDKHLLFQGGGGGLSQLRLGVEGGGVEGV
jgi:hypothetical protein